MRRTGMDVAHMNQTGRVAEEHPKPSWIAWDATKKLLA
jgi:hypothetical protein